MQIDWRHVFGVYEYMFPWSNVKAIVICNPEGRCERREILINTSPKFKHTRLSAISGLTIVTDELTAE